MRTFQGSPGEVLFFNLENGQQLYVVNPQNWELSDNLDTDSLTSVVIYDKSDSPILMKNGVECFRSMDLREAINHYNSVTVHDNTMYLDAQDHLRSKYLLSHECIVCGFDKYIETMGRLHLNVSRTAGEVLRGYTCQQTRYYSWMSFNPINFSRDILKIEVNPQQTI